MAADTHERSARDALRTVSRLRVLFGRLGSHARPRSGIFAAYVRARRALVGNLDNPVVVGQALGELRGQVWRAR